MSSFSKTHIIGIILAVIIVAGGIVYLATQKQEGPPALEEELKAAEGEEAVPAAEGAEPTLSLSGIILEVDAENSVLTVKPAGEAGQVKVYLLAETDIIKLTLPPAPGEGAVEGEPVAAEIEEITIEDIAPDSDVFIETETDISGKTEIRNVVRIQVLL